MICHRCGRHDAERREIYFRGLFEASVDICDSCFEAIVAGLEQKRREFGVLIDQGYSNEEANRIMIERLEAEAPSAAEAP